jgi:hypothetical protein
MTSLGGWMKETLPDNVLLGNSSVNDASYEEGEQYFCFVLEHGYWNGATGCGYLQLRLKHDDDWLHE